MSFIVLAHGGAGSFDHKEHDGPEAAAQAGLAKLEAGGTVLDAVLAATMALEDDERFNAGTGSNLRFDGKTIEMDAAVMTDDGRFGAVACIERVRHPVLVAADLLDTPHNLLAGRGATAYARARGHADHDPEAPVTRTKFERLRAMLASGDIEPGWCDWDISELRKHWNFEVPFEEAVGPTDTVGAVASDGTHYAAALSTGGTISTLLGRVGDVPLPGCGLHAGPHGAVCITGDGDPLARERLAGRVYDRMAAGASAQEALDWALGLFPDHVAVGLILIKDGAFAG
ncbi:MAG: isoaspartyl peptidase/L-asparaginase, partial [Thermoplasmatota archaeon]